MSFTILIHILIPFLRSNFFFEVFKTVLLIQFTCHSLHPFKVHNSIFLKKKKKKRTPHKVVQPLLLFSCSATSDSANPKACSTPGFPVHHHLLELVQTQVHGISDAIQPSHPLSSPSPPAFNLSQHQGHFK